MLNSTFFYITKGLSLKKWGRGFGFTLIELMITVAIVAILVTVGVPSFVEIVKNNRMTNLTGEIMTTLRLARSEAVRRGAVVCLKAKGSTAGNWSEGWNVFPEKSTDTTPCLTVDNIIQTYDLLPTGYTLKTATGGSFSTAIRYNPMGVAVNSSGVPVGGATGDVFKLCRGTSTSDIAKSKEISISATGQPVLKTSPPTSCP